MRRLRVLVTADTVGGVWTYALELARALASLDVDVVLAAMGEVSPDRRRAVAGLRNVELHARRFALEWMSACWPDVDAAGEWLLELAARTRPDVVHVNGYAHAALAFAAPVVAVAHSCVLTWYRAVRGCDAPAEWTEYRRRVARGLRAADAIVAPTAAIARDVLAAHGVDVPARVIPNGRASAEWPPAEKEPFVLAAGRLWDDAKGIPALARYAPQSPWPIYVAGSAVDAPALRCLGELSPPALARWAGRAAIYALPACYEPFGLSILEAALAGCALVIGDIPSLREIWGDTATYVAPCDPAALAAAIEGLVAEPARRGECAAAARERALAFTPAAMARGYRGLYDELCAQRRKASA